MRNQMTIPVKRNKHSCNEDVLETEKYVFGEGLLVVGFEYENPSSSATSQFSDRKLMIYPCDIC